MSREVRKVPANWKHPVDDGGVLVPLHARSFAVDAAMWDEGKSQWSAEQTALYESSYEEWEGPRPVADEYMPEFPDHERTHWQMYETTSEGTPISPVMESPEALAKWLADSGASSFGSRTATYEQWLRVARGGWAPSAVVAGGEIVSGVEGLCADPGEMPK